MKEIRFRSLTKGILIGEIIEETKMEFKVKWKGYKTNWIAKHHHAILD